MSVSSMKGSPVIVLVYLAGGVATNRRRERQSAVLFRSSEALTAVESWLGQLGAGSVGSPLIG